MVRRRLSGRSRRAIDRGRRRGAELPMRLPPFSLAHQKPSKSGCHVPKAAATPTRSMARTKKRVRDDDLAAQKSLAAARGSWRWTAASLHEAARLKSTQELDELPPPKRSCARDSTEEDSDMEAEATAQVCTRHRPICTHEWFDFGLHLNRARHACVVRRTFRRAAAQERR